MKYMQLTAETLRVRNAARAHAAGEMTQREYRRIRRDAIAHFVMEAATDDDDTQRRWEAADPHATRPERTRWAFLTSLLLAALLLAFVAQSGFAAVIVPVNERDPNPQTSTRYEVESLSVRDFEAFAELGITQESVATFLQAELDKARTTETPLAHGFTRSELDEVGNLMSALGLHDAGARLGQAEASEIVRLVRAQKARRGVSLVALERIAAALGEFYREKGLFLAIGFVPSQELRDRHVELGVLPGKLSEVGVDDPLLADAFASVINEAVVKRDIETILFRINRLPGVHTQGVFSAGTKVGETRLDLALLEKRRWRGGLSFDNHGDTHSSGERLVARYGLSSLLRPGDDLLFSLVAGVGSADNRYGWIRYEAPVTSLRNRWFVELGSNEFTWNPPAAEFAGDSRFSTLGIKREFLDSRTHARAGRISVSRHALGLSGREDQTLWFATGAVTSHRVFDQRRIAFDGELAIDWGRVTSGLIEGQNGDLWRAGAALETWKLISVPGFDMAQKLKLSVSGQLADDRLPDSLRMVLGGAHRVRAFDPSYFSADRAVVINLDLRLAVQPIAQYGDVIVFFDAAYGETFGSLAGRSHLSALGLGFDWKIGEKTRSLFSWSIPTADKGLAGFSHDGSTFYWTLTYEP